MTELFFSLQEDLDSICLKFKNPKVNRTSGAAPPPRRDSDI
ncbi:MAG TPA: hypothetical protein VEU62_23160 [Bryobacterales bacterium]|nr:hypothetical protein [Bryobacterales bacterium]